MLTEQPTDERNVETITTMTVAMRSAIGRAAAARQLTVSSWIRCAVREQLKAEGMRI
jgi:hypothetical protein